MGSNSNSLASQDSHLEQTLITIQKLGGWRGLYLGGDWELSGQLDLPEV